MLFFPPSGECCRGWFQCGNASSCAADRHLSRTLLEPTEDLHHPLSNLWMSPACHFYRLWSVYTFDFLAAVAGLILFPVSSDVKGLGMKQQGEDSEKTGGWDTSGLMHAIMKKKKKPWRISCCLKGWLPVARCHRTSSYVAPFLCLAAECCGTKEDLCILKPLVEKRLTFPQEQETRKSSATFS